MTEQTSTIAKQAETPRVSPQLADAYIALQAARMRSRVVWPLRVVIA